MMYGYYGYGPNMMFNGYGFWGSIVSLIFWIVVIALIVGLISAIVRGGRWHRWEHMHGRGYNYHDESSSQQGNQRALDILNERYAKGEINKEEYEGKKSDILNK